MKRLIAVAFLVIAAFFAIASVGFAQSRPAFQLGFSALAGQIPSAVGEPLESEHWGASGDSLQQTTTGLMVWRKADNWTAFTNGARTWVNGPFGVIERANDERFEWEAPPVPAAPGLASVPAPGSPPSAAGPGQNTGSTPTPTATVSAVPQIAPPATGTARPTLTPWPTWTPWPTSTPWPTATPRPASSSSSGSGYTNVDGVWVPSPGNDPTGASAQCRDGTYSYSQHRQGTCSGHGGVARWLN